MVENNNINKKILIVGADSYIGNAFKRFIDQNYNNKEWIIDKVGASNGDWKEQDFCGYDVILHAAAIVHKKETVDAKDMYNSVNFDLAVKVAQKAKNVGVSQFIFLSSIAVYGSINGVITEKTRTKPTTYYGQSKLSAEKELLKMNSPEFKVAVLRIPMVYGPDCKGNFMRLVKLASIVPFFPDIHNKRSMIYIENLCEYIYIIADKESKGIGIPQNSKTVDTALLFYLLRKLQGKKTYRIKYFNGVIYKLASKLESLNKMFGDCYFISSKGIEEGSWIKIEPEEYNRFAFRESIKKCIVNANFAD